MSWIIVNIIRNEWIHKETEPNRRISLRRIEDQCRDAEALCTGPRNVCGTDVAAAHRANVLLTKQANQNVAEGNGAEQVRDDGDNDIGLHSVRYVSGKLFSFEYTAPPGPNLLSYKKNSVACMVPNSGAGIAVILSASRMRAGVGGSCFFGRGDPEPDRASVRCGENLRSSDSIPSAAQALSIACASGARLASPSMPAQKTRGA